MDEGIIQDIVVSADLDDINIVVIDFDIEGSDHPSIIQIPNGEEAFVFEPEFNVINDGDVEYYEELKRRIYDGE